MGHIPISADMLFKDFAMEVLEYDVLDSNSVAGTYQGIPGDDENGKYIGFRMSDQPQISAGNTLRTADGLESCHITSVSYDRYNGNPELLKAYY